MSHDDSIANHHRFAEKLCQSLVDPHGQRVGEATVGVLMKPFVLHHMKHTHARMVARKKRERASRRSGEKHSSASVGVDAVAVPQHVEVIAFMREHEHEGNFRSLLREPAQTSRILVVHEFKVRAVQLSEVAAEIAQHAVVLGADLAPCAREVVWLVLRRGANRARHTGFGAHQCDTRPRHQDRDRQPRAAKAISRTKPWLSSYP